MSNESYYVLFDEPFNGMTPPETLMWINAGITEQTLADAYATVHNHVGSLGHELDSDDPWLFGAYDSWYEVENELIRLIRAVLERENSEGKTEHILTNIGTYYMAKPFMEAHGYRAGSGWWIGNDRWESSFSDNSVTN